MGMDQLEQQMEMGEALLNLQAARRLWRVCRSLVESETVPEELVKAYEPLNGPYDDDEVVIGEDVLVKIQAAG